MIADLNLKMSSKQVFIDNLPFVRSSQTVRRINEPGHWINENIKNKDVTLDLQKSTTFPWEAVGHARRTGGQQVQVEYLPKDQMYKSVDGRSLPRRGILHGTPLIPDQKEKQMRKQIFSEGHGCVSLEDLPHPSKLTKRKKYQQKKYSKLDLGKMYASQLKKKLEQFSGSAESLYQKKDSNATNYSEENVFEQLTLSTIDGEEPVQQVPRTPTLRNNSFSLAEFPSVISDKNFGISPSCYKNELDNSRTTTGCYHEESIPWSKVSQSQEWHEGDQLPFISLK